MKNKRKAILLVGALLCLNLNIFSQNIPLKMNKVSVKKAMTELKEKSGYSFVYIAGDLDTKKIVDIDAEQLQEVIEQILEGQNVSYEIKDKNIIIRKKEVEQSMLNEKKLQDISGLVMDVMGEPIVGVNVMEKGTTNGTITDMDGKFLLKAPANATLIISFIGYKTLAVNLEGEKNVNITLKEDLEQLDEVDIIANEISMFYPKEHIYKNVSQIVMLQKMDSDKEDDASIRCLNELIDIVKKSISKRDQNTNFNVGVGEIVKGYRNLKNSYKQSRIAMKFMKIARRITGDINKSIVYYSKLGIFQSFIELDDINKLKKYVPCTITKLDNYDRKHNTELLHTLNSYIRNNLSVKKTSLDLMIQYRLASYRIKKIKEITNINFDDNIELLSLRNGLIIFDIIHNM